MVGDKVLLLIAKMLGDLKDSKAIRYGGDEFIVVSKLDKLKAEDFFKKLTQELAKKSFKYKNKKFKINFSYGIEEFKKGDSFSDIVEKVDEVMYKQKRSRRKKELEVA
jgi:diguanylate cyclase (GGDEF)-like protein